MRIKGSVRSIGRRTASSAPGEFAGDGRAIFDDAPATRVEFRPRAIRPAGRRGPVLVAAWIVGLAAVAGYGLLDRAMQPGTVPARPTTADGRSAEPTLAPRTVDPTPVGDSVAAAGVVDLRSPAPAGNDVTTRQVTVIGTVLVRAATLRIALEARGNRVLDQVVVDVSDPDGGIRPRQTPRFSTSFDLPFPRPNDPMWVVVTAYDGHDLPLGATRRRFTIGPLLETPPPLADSQLLSEAWRPAPIDPGAMPGDPGTCPSPEPATPSSC